MFIRDKQRANCEAAEPRPHAVRGPREREGDRERKERGGKRLSNIINLHSLRLQWPMQGPGCARLHRGNVQERGHRLSLAKEEENVARSEKEAGWADKNEISKTSLVYGLDKYD